MLCIVLLLGGGGKKRYLRQMKKQCRITLHVVYLKQQYIFKRKIPGNDR